MSTTLQLRTIRMIAYLLILLMGIAQAWATRHIIFSDGISYIEIAAAYLNGDWVNAINPYWSPLYSWFIAAMLWVLRPGTYWQASMLHIVNFIAYAGGVVALDLLLREVLLTMRDESAGSERTLSPFTLYVAAYTAFPVAALGIIGYNSPDTISIALMLLLSALILRVKRTGGSPITFLLIGAVCGVFYLARTGFAPSIPICIAAVLILLKQQRRPLIGPGLIMAAAVVAVSAPFITAISLKENKFTIGESGRLTYGWEASGAVRFTHWQGEPYDIGLPIHPTKRVSTHPDAYVFNGPVGGSYPPWYDPTYWYSGIKPKLKPALQVRVFLIGLVLVLRLLASSPITVPCLILIVHMGVLAWFRRLWSFWPILIPTLAGLLLYCLVYVEKRYIASNLIVIWLAVLGSIQVREDKWRYWGNTLTQGLCLVFFAYFLYARVLPAAASSLWDLVHLKEREKNINFILAERFRQLGLHAREKVAFVGMGTNADWARLDNVRIVGEIPIVWQRHQKLLDNYLVENSDQIKAFWDADAGKRKQVLDAFRNAGAVMVVTDGLYNSRFPSDWQQVLTPAQIGKPRSKEDADYELRDKYRYLWLVPSRAEQSTSAASDHRAGGKSL